MMATATLFYKLILEWWQRQQQFLEKYQNDGNGNNILLNNIKCMATATVFYKLMLKLWQHQQHINNIKIIATATAYNP